MKNDKYEMTNEIIKAIAQHRHWEREDSKS